MSLFNAIPYRLLWIVGKKRHFVVFCDGPSPPNVWNRIVGLQRRDDWKRYSVWGMDRRQSTFWNVTSACNDGTWGNGIRFGGVRRHPTFWNRDVGLQRRDDWKRQYGLGVETP